MTTPANGTSGEVHVHYARNESLGRLPCRTKLIHSPAGSQTSSQEQVTLLASTAGTAIGTATVPEYKKTQTWTQLTQKITTTKHYLQHKNLCTTA